MLFRREIPPARRLVQQPIGNGVGDEDERVEVVAVQQEAVRQAVAFEGLLDDADRRSAGE